MTLAALSIIIPACNEEHRIGECLASLAAQQSLPVGAAIEVIVVANGCRDATAEKARSAAPALNLRGMSLSVVERGAGGKIGALNAGDALARAPARLYLDADIVLSDTVLARLMDALDSPAPVYAGAQLVVARPRSHVSRLYARFWGKLPFVTAGVSGAGFFAVNGPGRARWDSFPDIIADDAFVRGLFAASERVRIEASYTWPLNEGFGELVRVRRRQDAGLRQLAKTHGTLVNSGDTPNVAKVLRLGMRDPAGFAVYAAVRAASRVGRGQGGWDRGTR